MNFDFSLENPVKSADFPANFDFLPRENPVKLADFSCEFAPENPAKFNFFSMTYQKPWYKYSLQIK